MLQIFRLSRRCALNLATPFLCTVLISRAAFQALSLWLRTFKAMNLPLKRSLHWWELFYFCSLSNMFTLSFSLSLSFFCSCSPKSFQGPLRPLPQPIDFKGFSIHTAFLYCGLLPGQSLFVSIFYYFVSQFCYPSCIRTPVGHLTLVHVTFSLS